MSYSILILSDLHLREAKDDDRYKIFLKILESFEKDSSFQELFLMGDIFDILIGPKAFWKKIHRDFFNSLERIILKNKKICWVQGNHDFQLTKLLEPMGIQWIKESALLERENVKIYLSHGDLADWRDKLHPLWRAFLTSRFLAFCICLVPNKLAEKFFYPLGFAISRASRRASQKRAKEREEKARLIFRNYADKVAAHAGAELVILGHSHISENIRLPSGIHYSNLGSWFESAQVGVLELKQGAFDLKVFPAASWLSRNS